MKIEDKKLYIASGDDPVDIRDWVFGSFDEIVFTLSEITLRQVSLIEQLAPYYPVTLVVHPNTIGMLKGEDFQKILITCLPLPQFNIRYYVPVPDLGKFASKLNIRGYSDGNSFELVPAAPSVIEPAPDAVGYDLDGRN